MKSPPRRRLILLGRIRARVAHPGGRMTELVVRNEGDHRHALDVLAGPQGHLIGNVRFEGWPVFRMVTEEPLDLVRCAPRIEEMQERAHRAYCLVRYGRPDLRLMTGPDRAAAKLSAHFEGEHTLVVDMSHAMNGSMAAARARAMERVADGETINLFEVPAADNDHGGEKVGGNYGKWNAAADTVKHVANRLSPGAITAVLMFGVAMFAAGWTVSKCVEAKFEHVLAMKQEDNAQQLRIADLDVRRMTTRDGRVIKLTALSEQWLAREDAEDMRRVAMMERMDLEHPLLRFVSAESTDGLAAAIDMVPEQGRVWVNGAEIQAAAGRQAAKELRKAAKAKRAGSGWTVEVIPERSSGV